MRNYDELYPDGRDGTAAATVIPMKDATTLARPIEHASKPKRDVDRKTPNPADEFRLRRGSDVPMAAIRWAWDRRVPLGGVTLLPGREGLGKTSVGYWLCARLSRGELDGDLFGEPCDVVVIGHEDTISSVAIPRLIAAGADMARIWFLEAVDPEALAAFSVPGSVPELDRLLDRLANPRMIMVDPLDAHLNVDTHKKADTQRAIGSLALTAQRRELAVLGIAHHSKSPTIDPLDRVNGSKAFTTAARSVLTIAPHPDDDSQRVIACSKANLTQRETIEVLKFKIETAEVTRNGITATTSNVVWLGVAEGIDPDSVLAHRDDDDERDDADDARDVLAKILEPGPMWVKKVFDAMADAGFSKDQAKRAKTKLHISSKKIGAPGDDVVGWKWQLPTRLREHQQSEECGVQERTPLASLPLPSERDSLEGLDL
jgi:hypothetical protein